MYQLHNNCFLHFKFLKKIGTAIISRYQLDFSLNKNCIKNWVDRELIAFSRIRLSTFIICSDIWTMARSCQVSVIQSPNQNKINNILKFTYSQISSWINSFSFRIHINIVTMSRSRWASVTPLQIRNEINNIFNCYKQNRSLFPEEVVKSKLNSYHRKNHHYQN